MPNGICNKRISIRSDLNQRLEDIAESQHQSIGMIIENALNISGYSSNSSPIVEVRVGPSWGDK
jgi:hypothetical protein